MSSVLPNVRSSNACDSLAVAMPSGTPYDMAKLVTSETANSITHGLGLLLSVLAAVVLMDATRQIDFWQRVACEVYLGTMISVYAASTLSHWIRRPGLQHLFRMVDQGCIYLFIVGTFTPIATTFLRGGQWWILLAAMWTIALVGFVSKVILVYRINAASVAIPVLLGWMPMLGGGPLLDAIPAAVVWWMLAGGLCYMAGTLFLMTDHRHRYLHSVWHLCVIAGSACHFWAILHFTVPAMQS